MPTTRAPAAVATWSGSSESFAGTGPTRRRSAASCDSVVRPHRSRRRLAGIPSRNVSTAGRSSAAPTAIRPAPRARRSPVARPRRECSGASGWSPNACPHVQDEPRSRYLRERPPGPVAIVGAHRQHEPGLGDTSPPNASATTAAVGRPRAQNSGQAPGSHACTEPPGPSARASPPRRGSRLAHRGGGHDPRPEQPLEIDRHVEPPPLEAREEACVNVAIARRALSPLPATIGKRITSSILGMALHEALEAID